MKIGIVGHFACGRQLLNGQTVKTINLYEGLTKYTNHQIEIADTHRWTHHPLRLLCEVNRLFRHCDAVVMLPAHNGVKVFALLFALLQRIYGTRTYYDVIGGWLPSMLLEHKWLRRPLAHFSGIWVETTTMERALQQQGLENVAVVPNFKELTPLAPTALIYPEGIPFRLCTFSRVNREKGIETAVRALREVNEQLGFTAYTLDIYGPVDPAQAEWFAALQQTFPSCVAYRGTVDSSRSVEVLQGYFALLFPTHYYTEGIPGTIIDAYCAGVPVIAARWESFADVVKEGETGLGYPFDDAAALKALLLEVADEPAKLLKLKPNCLQQAQLFMPNRVINIQKTCLGGGNLSYCPLRLCTFSRVSKEKGIEDAVAVVTALNRRLGFTAYTLDIYGQVDTAYEARFAALQQTFPPEVRYCGCVPAAESVGIISKYFALLFPTYYPGEGFAGTLIDAFSAGVPVIASDWKYNGEIVHKGVGFLFRTHHLNELDHILTTLVAHPIQALTLKPACLREAARYSASAAIEQIAHLISG